MHAVGSWTLTPIFFGSHCAFEKNVNSCQHVKFERFHIKNVQILASPEKSAAPSLQHGRDYIGPGKDTFPDGHELSVHPGPSRPIHSLAAPGTWEAVGMAALLQRNGDILILGGRLESQGGPATLYCPRMHSHSSMILLGPWTEPLTHYSFNLQSHCRNFPQKQVQARF